MSLSKAASNSDLSSNEKGQKSNNKPEEIRLDPFGVLQRDAFQKVLNYVELKDLQNKNGVSREWREQIDLHIRHRANAKPNELTIRVVFPKPQNIYYGPLCDQYLFFCKDIVQSVTNHLANRLPEIDGELIVVSSEHFFHGASFLEFIQQYFAQQSVALTVYFEIVIEKSVSGAMGDRFAALIRSFVVSEGFCYKMLYKCIKMYCFAVIFAEPETFQSLPSRQLQFHRQLHASAVLRAQPVHHAERGASKHPLQWLLWT